MYTYICENKLFVESIESKRVSTCHVGFNVAPPIFLVEISLRPRSDVDDGTSRSVNGARGGGAVKRSCRILPRRYVTRSGWLIFFFSFRFFCSRDIEFHPERLQSGSLTLYDYRIVEAFRPSRGSIFSNNDRENR